MFKFLNLSLVFVIFSLSTNRINSTCTDTTPSTITDCTSQNSGSNYCCFAHGLGKNFNSTFCYEMPRIAYTGTNSINFNKTTYILDCGTITSYIPPLDFCGPSNPTSLDDCKLGSNNYVSCCYNNGYSNISPNCYNIQAKYKGKITWANLDLDCGAEYISSYQILIALYFILALL